MLRSYLFLPHRKNLSKMEKKKKVLHFVPTDRVSGQEQVVANIISMVDDYDHYWVSPGGPIEEFLESRGIVHVKVDKISPLSVRKAIQRYHPDIAHGHDITAGVSLAANALLCKRLGVKIVSHVHNNDDRMHKISPRSVIYGLASLALPRIIVVSQPVIDDFVFRPLLAKKATPIINVINPELIRDKVKGVDSAEKIWDVVCVGRLSYQKNPQLFVDAVKEMNSERPLRAVMVGAGDLEQEVRDYIVSNDLSSVIDLVGFQKNPYKYIVQSRAAMMTSRYEGYPMVALETLILGTPLIGTPVAGLEDLLDESCGGLATTAHEFSELGRAIVDSPELRAEKSAGAKNRALEVNNVQLFVDSIRKVYAS